MAMIADCPACAYGDHSKHVEHWGVRPEGVIDGDFCYCEGDCKPPEFSSEWAEWFNAKIDSLGDNT